MNQKYERMLEELTCSGRTQAKAFGHSMMPLIDSGSTLTFERKEHYQIGDIVFCKINGHYIDAHKITAERKGEGQFLISNNRGRDNGWTKQIFGKVIQAVSPTGITKHF